jgi:hypothetical protein
LGRPTLQTPKDRRRLKGGLLKEVRPLHKLYLRMRLLGIPGESLVRSPEAGNVPVLVTIVAIVVPQLIVVVPPKIPIPVPGTF